MPDGGTLAVLIKALAPTVAEKLLGVYKDYGKIKDKDMILLVLAMNAEQNAKTEKNIASMSDNIHQMNQCFDDMRKCILKLDEGVGTLLNRTERR